MSDTDAATATATATATALTAATAAAIPGLADAGTQQLQKPQQIQKEEAELLQKRQLRDILQRLL